MSEKSAKNSRSGSKFVRSAEGPGIARSRESAASGRYLAHVSLRRAARRHRAA